MIPDVPPGAFAPSVAADDNGRALVVFTVPARVNDGTVGPGIGNRNPLWFAFKRATGWEVGPIGTYAELPRVRITRDNQAVVLFRRFDEDVARLTGDVGTATADLTQTRLRWSLDYLTEDGQSNWEIAYDLDHEFGRHVALSVKQDPQDRRPVPAPDPAQRGQPMQLDVGNALAQLAALKFEHRPDLTIAPADILFSNPYPAVDELISITGRVHNIGFQAASAFNVRFYEVQTTSKVLLGEVSVSQPLGLGSVAEVTLSYRMRSPGLKTIQVVVDEADSVTETDEINNRAQALLGRLSKPPAPVVIADPKAGVLLLGGVPGTNHVVWHEVYRAIAPNGRFELIGGTSENTFTDSLATRGVEYIYRLVGIDAAGSASEPGLTATAMFLPAIQVGRVGNSLLLSWPNPSTGFVLQETASLQRNPNWQPASASVSVIGDRKQVMIPMGSQSAYYRLGKQ